MDQHNGRNNASLEITAAHSGAVHGIQFTNDGQFLISVGTDESMRLWNTDTGKSLNFVFNNCIFYLHPMFSLLE